MPNAAAHTIVITALSLRKSHPVARALDILDLALVGCEGSHPNFEDLSLSGDATEPEQPFAKLLYEALGPLVDVHPDGTAREPFTEPSDRHDAILAMLESRYCLWQSPAELTYHARALGCLFEMMRRVRAMPKADAEQRGNNHDLAIEAEALASDPANGHLTPLQILDRSPIWQRTGMERLEVCHA